MDWQGDGVDVKQIIVMRADLNMRKGKMVAQGAHASMGAILPYVSTCGPEYVEFDLHNHRGKVTEWLRGSFTKICVRVDSEDELMAVYENAMAADLIACLITDNGHTEFHGVPTKTCAAIGPDLDENLAPITGALRLL